LYVVVCCRLQATCTRPEPDRPVVAGKSPK
jgi:hypothetical protein